MLTKKTFVKKGDVILSKRIMRIASDGIEFEDGGRISYGETQLQIEFGSYILFIEKGMEPETAIVTTISSSRRTEG